MKTKQHKGILIVVSGFSGAGKGTLMKRLVSDYDNYALSVSMTTRQPRTGEVDGREYFFSTKEEFEKKIEEEGLVDMPATVATTTEPRESMWRRSWKRGRM